MKIPKQKRVTHIAHILYRHDCELSVISNIEPDWSESMTKAWRIQRVRDALLKGIVQLYFEKSDGMTIMRHGTLSADHIPGSKMPKGIQEQLIADGAAEPVWTAVAYYDIDARGWRSFKVEKLHKAIPAVDISRPVYTTSGKRLY